MVEYRLLEGDHGTLSLQAWRQIWIFIQSIGCVGCGKQRPDLGVVIRDNIECLDHERFIIRKRIGVYVDGVLDLGQGLFGQRLVAVDVRLEIAHGSHEDVAIEGHRLHPHPVNRAVFVKDETSIIIPHIVHIPTAT